MIIATLRSLFHRLKYNRFMDYLYTNRLFKQQFGRALNLQQPASFNEKIQWLKLRDKSPIKTVLADKYQVRQFVAERVGSQYLVPLLFETTEVSELNANNLPQPPFVIKTNHASGNVLLITKSEHLDYAAIQASVASHLRFNFYHAHREWQYKHIKKRILVEQFIGDADGLPPADYKLHCFHGEPKFVQVDYDRFSEHKRTIYDVNWNKLDVAWRFKRGDDWPKPQRLEEMLQVARALAEDFAYLRVDLYETKDQVLFGELTFTPGAGFEIFNPASTDEQWGKLFSLPKQA